MNVKVVTSFLIQYFVYYKRNARYIYEYDNYIKIRIHKTDVTYLQVVTEIDCYATSSCQ